MHTASTNRFIAKDSKDRETNCLSIFVLHNDLNPGNILLKMVNDTFQFKIIDYGMSYSAYDIISNVNQNAYCHTGYVSKNIFVTSFIIHLQHNIS